MHRPLSFASPVFHRAVQRPLPPVWMPSASTAKSFHSTVRVCGVWKDSRPQTVKWHRDEAPVGQLSTVEGWVRSVRHQKGVTFMEVNDGSSLKSLQVVMDEPQAKALGLTTGCSVRVSGEVLKSPHAAQRVELAAKAVDVIGPCDAKAYPLQKKVRGG